MHEFKRRHYERDNPGVRFPQVERLDESAIGAQIERLRALVGYRVRADGPEVFRELIRSSRRIEGMDAATDEFRLEQVWHALSMQPLDKMLLTFDALRSIDAIQTADVERAFHAIWYPTSDDLLLCDFSGRWSVIVDHDGNVYAMCG
jgi:hypothetical protein